MGGGATVLAIDDDDHVRRAFRRVLDRAGYQVIEAGDGASGLAQFRASAPDAVLLDLRMPGTDGLDVLSELVAEAPETPVLVVSGEGTITDVVEALRRGAWDFVTKPIESPELLTRAIERGREKARLLRQNREYAESLHAINGRLSQALDELRRDEQAARQLQFQLLPADGMTFRGVSCFRRVFPSQLLCGDFVDYFPLAERFLGFYVADVAGHGAASAFMTAILTTLVGKYREALAARGDETILAPESLLSRLHADLRQHDLDKHITMFYGVIDTGSGKLVYANAGAFPYPFVCDRQDVRELECPGRPLNLPGRGRLGHGETVLEDGGRLLIASDGVLELARERTGRQTREAMAELAGGARSIDDVLAGLAVNESTVLADDVAVLLVTREAAHAG